MDPSKSKVLNYFKRRILEEGEPVVFSRLATYVFDPFMENMRDAILGSDSKNCLEGR